MEVIDKVVDNVMSAELVSELAAAGADVNARSGKWGMTPLMYAAWKGHTEVVRALLRCGADLSLSRLEHSTCQTHRRQGQRTNFNQSPLCRCRCGTPRLCKP